MEKFKKIVGIAAPFTRINVDTDLIIPAENLKTISRQGLGKGLFSYIRFNEDGSECANCEGAQSYCIGDILYNVLPTMN